VTPTPGPEDPLPPRAGAAEASPARPPARVALEYLVAHGDPVAEILRTAAEQRCDLIILGSGGDPGWKRWLRRSRAEQVIRRAVRAPGAARGDAPEPPRRGRPTAPAHAPPPRPAGAVLRLSPPATPRPRMPWIDPAMPWNPGTCARNRGARFQRASSSRHVGN